jgi:hypothetical protein
MSDNVFGFLGFMQVLAVFVLYVRCAGCDPADPGVHQSKRAARAKQRAAAALKAKDLALSNINTGSENPPDHESEKKAPYLGASGSSASCARGLCLPIFACCKKDDSAKLNAGEQLLYCSICEAEVRAAHVLTGPFSFPSGDSYLELRFTK